MNQLEIQANPEVQGVFEKYPAEIRGKLEKLRQLIIEAATEIPEIKSLEETLKWGEPSYISKYGSTLRIDWKPKKPDQYAMYFKCTSKLVPTFKSLYADKFVFEGNRAIVFQLDEELPETELKDCIKAGLLYHKVKNLPHLGM